MRCVALPLFLVSIACNGGRERAPEAQRASDSMRAGKEFEDRVFESLGSGAQRDVRVPIP